MPVLRSGGKEKQMENANGIDVLDKKQFWEPLFEECPDVAEKFYKWIDEYKNSVKWHDVFPIGSRLYYWNDIKFHHLPTAMQVGIVLEFSDQMLQIEDPDENDEGIQDMITLIFHNWSDKYKKKKKAAQKAKDAEYEDLEEDEFGWPIDKK